MSAECLIRRGDMEDLDDLVRFQVAMAAESEDKGLDPQTLAAGVTHLISRPLEGFYLVAEVDGRAAGSLMVTFEWSDWRNGRFWWIQSVYVDPAFRRRGIYSALHQHVKDAAHADPESCGLRLYVEQENSGAQATYLALGMVQTHYRMFEEEF
ncbi:MAG: GNAT family N-acetyltransferase [Pseudomonadales bacterium]|nr:GNAT family N-acetyltransferase [Pseudomonadales bacterium]